MLSIFNWFGYRDLTRAEGFRLIRQAGFDAVLLWWDYAESGEEYRRQPELARREGLYIENIHSNDENANAIWEDTQDGQAVYEYYLQCIDGCAAFEIPTVVVHPANGEAPPASETGLLRFARLIEHAERKNVNVALENMRRASQVAQTALLLERFGSKRLGFCLDNGHYHARIEHDLDLLPRFGHRLMALHLSDNNGKRGDHRLPFDGNIDWPSQMHKIAATGYQGPTALEVMNLGYEHLPPAEFLALAYERAAKLEQLRNPELLSY